MNFLNFGPVVLSNTYMALQEVKDILAKATSIQLAMAQDEELLKKIDQVIQICTIAFKTGKKILFCGNGGSAADAQHLAAELSGRFYLERPALFAEALNVNTSVLTAVGNDYSFDEIFARQVQGKGAKGDVLFAISTSGKSANVIRAAEEARKLNMIVIGMTGKGGGLLSGLTDILLQVPSADTPRIQEVHILMGHIICEQCEQALFG